MHANLLVYKTRLTSLWSTWTLTCQLINWTNRNKVWRSLTLLPDVPPACDIALHATLEQGARRGQADRTDIIWPLYWGGQLHQRHILPTLRFNVTPWDYYTAHTMRWLVKVDAIQQVLSNIDDVRAHIGRTGKEQRGIKRCLQPEWNSYSLMRVFKQERLTRNKYSWRVLTKFAKAEFTCWNFCHLLSYLGKQWAADRTHFSVMMEPPQMWRAMDVWKPRGEKESESPSASPAKTSQQVSEDKQTRKTQQNITVQIRC